MNLKFTSGIVAIVCIFGFQPNLLAQTSKTVLSKEEKKFYNWHNLDIKRNKILGISTDKAYRELLKNKVATRVIVAVIDGGIDINHEDLQNKIWINTNEIPANGIDDDKNGYIDDINGWNFIGGADGQNIGKENLELTRLYRFYSKKFGNADSSVIADTEKDEFNEYKKIRKDFLEESNEAQKKYNRFLPVMQSCSFADSVMQSYFGRKDYTLKNLKKLRPGNNIDLINSKDLLVKFYRKGYSLSQLIEYFESLETKYHYQVNTSFNPREIVGDDPTQMSDGAYGNNDIIGPNADHGTFVAGIIAAERNNKLGVNGIVDSVKIMVIRAVPDGDEYDKDIANAIIYAVNNGASVINCSFGKIYSPQKHFVDEAIKYANGKDVLIVHAAGNDAENNDTITHYPVNYYSNGTIINDNWITVGASSLKDNSALVATFSNYGKKTVDIFAPGYKIYSTLPSNKYDALSGTSFSSPVVAGAAALLKSYYPFLSAKQIKEILLQSGTKYPDLLVYPPSEMNLKIRDSRVKFGTLSQTGSILNVYNAIKLAEKYVSM